MRAPSTHPIPAAHLRCAAPAVALSCWPSCHTCCCTSAHAPAGGGCLQSWPAQTRARHQGSPSQQQCLQQRQQKRVAAGMRPKALPSETGRASSCCCCNAYLQAAVGPAACHQHKRCCCCCHPVCRQHPSPSTGHMVKQDGCQLCCAPPQAVLGFWFASASDSKKGGLHMQK